MGVTHTCPPPRAPRPAPLSHAPGPVCDAAGAGMASVLSKASHAARASGGGGGRGEGGVSGTLREAKASDRFWTRPASRTPSAPASAALPSNLQAAALNRSCCTDAMCRSG